jgi:hypothetical protein
VRKIRHAFLLLSEGTPVRARAFQRKQQIYTAIERENARAAMDGSIREREIVAPAAPVPAREDDRDPVDVARAAADALRAATA